MRRKNVFKFIIFGVSISSILFSCGKRLEEQNTPNSTQLKQNSLSLNSELQKPESIIPPDNTGIALGVGFDSKSQESTTKCIDGDIRYVGQHSMETNIYHNMDMHSLVNELSGNVNGQAQYSVFKGSALAEYVSQIASDEYSETFTSITTYRAKQLTLTHLKTSFYGAAFVNPDNTVKNNVTQICGDEFVNAVNVGAKLIYTIKFNFENKSQKQTFDGTINAGITNLGQLFGKIATLDENLSSKISFELTARQFGGDKTKLSGAITDSIINCNIKTIQKCIDIVDGLEKYRINDFSDQMHEIELNPLKENGFTVISWQTARHADHLVANKNSAIRLIPKNYSPILDFELEQLKKDLLYRYEEELTHHNRAYALLYNFGINNEYVKDQLNDILSKSKKNRYKISFAADTCFSDPSNCKNATQDAYASLENYNSGVLQSYVSNILPKYNLTGQWTSWKTPSINIFQLAQTGAQIAMGVYDYRGDFTFYSYNGTFIDDETAFLPITVIKRKQDNTYCHLNATAKLSIIDDENFDLRIKYSSKNNYIECFETDKFPICTKGDPYDCLDKIRFERFPF
ncbi:hypothetical protein [Fluviispira multicolorata]|uniref:MAC/Perforin domain-containing protein n=1 Tax=Fluviispira multicolorata TaxID=2654512 RepID=A0A833N1Z4_9BACT|nr:hypothetical protein [Fluviispira multicolorata]KAB8031867.1 hypothetical protein GCL57_04275 [Fluviispira multicolorata]